MNEAQFKTAMIKWLKDNGAYAVRTVTGGAQVVGTPDLLVCWRGWFVGLEAKRSAREKATPWQLRRLEEIKAAGGLAWVAFPENWPDIKAALQALESKGV